MGILSRLESESNDSEEVWEKDKCFGIEFNKTTDLVRTWLKDKSGEIIGP
jgi:hypothetical protein